MKPESQKTQGARSAAPGPILPPKRNRKRKQGHRPIRRFLPPRDRMAMPCSGAGDRDRTGTGVTTHGILSPGRLPISPLRQGKIIMRRPLPHSSPYLPIYCINCKMRSQERALRPPLPRLFSRSFRLFADFCDALLLFLLFSATLFPSPFQGPSGTLLLISPGLLSLPKIPFCQKRGGRIRALP